ncbi:MAG: hypothetical protein IMY67_01290 [Bacteroidetes bacterium]|nr:hypothetical protein [Bacteroidota bacterium]
MRILIIIFFFSISVSAQKTYQKIYFDNGNLKAEGWLVNNQKIDYWKFYHPNGNLKKEGAFSINKKTEYWYFYRENGTKEKEGHFINDVENKWWIFYDDIGYINYKCQLINNQKSGYCFKYKNKEIVKAEKYKAGKKIKEWMDLNSFKKENNLRDL